MAFCGTCGAALEEGATVCGICGAAVEAEAAPVVEEGTYEAPAQETAAYEAPAQEYAAPQAAPAGDMQFDPEDVEKNKYMAILSYLGILGLIPYFAAPESKFARAHAVQGLNMTILTFLLCLIVCIAPIIGIIGLVLNIMGIINCVNGVYKTLPIFGEKIKWVK